MTNDLRRPSNQHRQRQHFGPDAYGPCPSQAGACQQPRASGAGHHPCPHRIDLYRRFPDGAAVPLASRALRTIAVQPAKWYLGPHDHYRADWEPDHDRRSPFGILRGRFKMRKDNPAVYECPKGKNGLHYWRRNGQTRRATCQNCKLELNQEDTAEVFNDLGPI